MKRWVVLGAVVLIAFAVLLLRQLDTSEAVALSEPRPADVAKLELPPPPKFVEPMNSPEVEEPPEVAASDEPPEKLDPKSQEFFLRFDEMIAPRLTKEAADCYNGGKQRDQKIKFGFVSRIRDGRVTIREVKVMESTLGDANLERCMLEKVANFASWQDDQFPDIDQEDEVLIRIRALKKYKQEEDREYFPPTKLIDAK